MSTENDTKTEADAAPECDIFPHCHLPLMHAGWCQRLTSEQVDRELAEARITQPAGEHHTGTLDLAGQGNPGTPLIPDAAVEKAGRAYWVNYQPEEASGLNIALSPHHQAAIRAALESAYPAIRQQVAEEIAVATEEFLGRGKPAGPIAVDIARKIGAGTW
jgi:hypothetical protein